MPFLLHLSTWSLLLIFIQITYQKLTYSIFYLFFTFCLPSAEHKLHEARDFCVFHSLLIAPEPQAMPNSGQVCDTYVLNQR